jgi:hypothetical protein
VRAVFLSFVPYEEMSTGPLTVSPENCDYCTRTVVQVTFWLSLGLKEFLALRTCDALTVLPCGPFPLLWRMCVAVKVLESCDI